LLQRRGHYFSVHTGSTNDCTDGVALNGRCYRRVQTSLTWYSARNKCAERGGDLASFETLSDNTFNSTLRSTLFTNSSATEFWVGMERVDWRWEDTGNLNSHPGPSFRPCYYSWCLAPENKYLVQKYTLKSLLFQKFETGSRMLRL